MADFLLVHKLGGLQDNKRSSQFSHSLNVSSLKVHSRAYLSSLPAAGGAEEDVSSVPVRHGERQRDSKRDDSVVNSL